MLFSWGFIGIRAHNLIYYPYDKFLKKYFFCNFLTVSNQFCILIDLINLLTHHVKIVRMRESYKRFVSTVETPRFKYFKFVIIMKKYNQIFK
jgi:hypothetical protein